MTSEIIRTCAKIDDYAVDADGLIRNEDTDNASKYVLDGFVIPEDVTLETRTASTHTHTHTNYLH